MANRQLKELQNQKDRLRIMVTSQWSIVFAVLIIWVVLTFAPGFNLLGIASALAVFALVNTAKLITVKKELNGRNKR